MIEIADCTSNQHASITIYHQKLDDLLEKYEDGYVILNPDVIPSIVRTRNEEEKENEAVETDEDSSSIDMEEDSDLCEEIPQSIKRDHPEDDTTLESVAKRQFCVC